MRTQIPSEDSVSANLGRLFTAVVPAVTKSASPSAAWEAVAAAVDTTGFRIPYELRVWDISDEVAELATQLAVVRELARLPADLTFLYFGLFDWADVEDPA